MPNVKETVEQYISRGWSVVPLAPGEKACKDADWQNLVFQPDDFDDGDNVGIKSVGGIVIIDEDSIETVALADEFLPGTGAIYGRYSKPKSKRIYRCKYDGKIIQYKDEAEVLIEIRVNHQDMAPPSRHPSGEELAWYSQEEPTDVTFEVLNRCVQLLATAALIARNYNPPEQRHYWCMALAGELKNLGLNEKEATQVIRSGADLAGETDLTDRLNVVSSTFAKGSNEAMSAGKDLQEHSKTKTFPKSLRKIWGMGKGSSLNKEDMEFMNKRHAVVFQESGALMIITESIKDNKQFLRYSSLDTIRNLYTDLSPSHIDSKGEIVYRKRGVVWLDYRERRQYGGIELNSKGTTPGYYNLWKGFAYEPKKGSWEGYKKHLLDVVAAGNREHATWIFQWMAAVIQDPTTHAHTAIALQGGQGVGKSTFAEWFGALFGSHFLEISDYDRLVGRFNAHLHHSILVFGDEVTWGGRRGGIGNLRRMVTQDTISIERKGLDIVTVPNHIHLILASNEDWIIPAHSQERRFAIFKVSNCHQKDQVFFGGVQKELFQEGGLEALLYDLLECKITVDLRTIPETEALGEQKQYSAEPFLKWLISMCAEGDMIWDVSYKGDENIFQIDKTVLYERYLEDSKEMGVRHRLEKNAFYRKLKKILQGWPREYRNRKQKSRLAVFPSLADCRKLLEAQLGTQMDWDDIIEDETTEKMPF